MNNKYTLVDTFVKALKERSEQSGSGLDYAMGYLHSTLQTLLDLDRWGTQANRLRAATAILHELIDNNAAVTAKCNQDDSWVPACGGLEVPFKSRSGKRLQYVWQPSTGQHAYLDVDSDIILSDEEAEACLALY